MSPGTFAPWIRISTRAVAFALLCAFLSGSISLAGAQEPAAQAAPARLIPVPFFSYAEALDLDYEHRRILNAAVPAAIAMVLLHWERSPALLARYDDALPRSGGWAIVTQADGGSLDKLERFLDRGVPVIVTPTLTSIAHPHNPMLEILAAIQQVRLRPVVPLSGVMLSMRSLEEYADMKRRMDKHFHWESLLSHAQVVVGYDHKRRILIVHDPLFGPAIEVPYAEFDRAWKATNRHYIAVEARSGPAAVADRAPARARTSAEMAIELFVRGYAAASLRKYDEADSLFRGALAVESLPSVLQYVVVNERAHVAWIDGKETVALRLAEEAIGLRPQAPSPWRLVASITKNRGGPDVRKRFETADATVKRLCADADAMKALYGELRKHIQVWSLGCGEKPVRETQIR